MKKIAKFNLRYEVTNPVVLDTWRRLFAGKPGSQFVMTKMEGCCSFKALVGGVCGSDAKDPKGGTEIVPLLSCDRDIRNHKSLNKFSGPKDEVELILCRAAKFKENDRLSSMTICPNHRGKLGIGWSRGSRPRCKVPDEISNHGKRRGVWPKGDRGLGKKESELILRRTGLFVQVGSGKFYFPLYRFNCVINGNLIALLCHHSGVCRSCRGRLKVITDIEVHDTSDPLFEIISKMERMTLVSIGCFT